jgi:hypothetical protein
LKQKNKVCQTLVAGRGFSPGTPVSSSNKIDRHDITENNLKVALSTINLNQTNQFLIGFDSNFKTLKKASVRLSLLIFNTTLNSNISVL